MIHFWVTIGGGMLLGVIATLSVQYQIRKAQHDYDPWLEEVAEALSRDIIRPNCEAAVAEAKRNHPSNRRPW